MNTARRAPRSRSRGLTLIEVSLVIVVLGFIALLLAELLPGFKRAAMHKDSIYALQTAQTAMRGFILINGRLPCPDSNGDGMEDRAADGCTQLTGVLPYRSLGLGGPLENAAGFPFRYGVFHRSNASVASDAGLTRVIDRLQPKIAEGLPPALAPRLRGNSNLLDYCAAVQAAQGLPTDANQIHVALAAGSVNIRENVAYVLAEPGAADMNVNGSAFDGSNAAGLRFEHPTRAPGRDYDDRVVVAYFTDMWEELGCSSLVASTVRAYPNTESGLAMFRQSLRDYKAQLELTREMAEADRLQKIASLAKGIGSAAVAAAALPTSLASSINTAGGTSGSVAAAGVAIGLNAAATAYAAANLVVGDEIRNKLDARLGEAGGLITAVDALHDGVRTRAIEADRDAFSAR
ncbi:hypothetical protein TMEC54S_03352 [Thauera mechernichensis]